MDLSVNLADIRLKNPIILASGTAGYGLELTGFLDPAHFGAIVLKSVTLKPRYGNPPPRIWETPCGILNSIGLENVGVEALISEKLPALAEINTEIIASIAGETVDEYRELAKLLGENEVISGFEINVSCPNVEKGGVEFCREPGLVREVLEAVRPMTEKPVFAKLSSVGDMVNLSKAAVDAGVDGLSLINTLPGMSIDVNSLRPGLGAKTGGLSGPALKPVALKAVWDCSAAVDVPVIGVGGVYSGRDALEFLAAGATAVAVGTALISDPRRPEMALAELRELMEERGYERLSDVIGIARREPDSLGG